MDAASASGSVWWARRPTAKKRLRSPTSLNHVRLLDLAMPRGPGMEVLRELAHQGLAVRTILLTAAIQPLSSALQLGARGIVLKASPPELLLQSVRAV